jgi:hypothetical protein
MGTTGEKIVAKVMRDSDIECEKESDHEKRYDHDLNCKIGRKKFTVEVKYDAMAQKTGNIAIEHHNCKKDEPSGIARTTATIWAHVVLDQGFPTVWIANTKKLRVWIENNKPFKEIYAGGDDNACLWLYRDTDILYEAFHRIDNLDKEKATKLIRSLAK